MVCYSSCRRMVACYVRIVCYSSYRRMVCCSSYRRMVWFSS
jgi:hypothetical protein